MPGAASSNAEINSRSFKIDKMINKSKQDRIIGDGA
jgi:hypothetical protein